MSINAVAITLGLYTAFLFLLAAWGDRHAARLDLNAGRRSLMLALSLGVYCTSWTFYGAVGEASRNGWDYLPIYLGPALLFLLGYPIIRRLVRLGRKHDTGSIADFLAARFGKSALVGSLAAIVLAVASVPYVALQLKSTATSLELLVGSEAREIDWALLSTIAFAAFAILFGARRPDTSSGNRGLVLAVAFEAVVKLIAMIAIGVLAWTIWNGMPASEQQTALAASPLTAPDMDVRFVVLTLLAGFAALCLPRQFHMLVVEARQPDDARRARWAFPAYLGLVALVAPPVALAGTMLSGNTNPDAFVLALPIASGSDSLALLAFIGGFSASAGMITVGALALSTMLVDAVAAPVLLQRGLQNRPRNLASRLLNYRRATILLLLLAAYLFHLGLDRQMALADIGLVAFAGAAQLGPALLFGLYWKRANRAGAVAGIATGSALWFTLVLLPSYGGTPLALPGEADAFAWMTLLSLVCNAIAFIIAVAFSPAHLTDRVQAARFSERDQASPAPAAATIRLADLQTLFEHVLGADGAQQAVADLQAIAGRSLESGGPVPREVLNWCEARLARAVGAPAARILIAQVLPGGGLSASDVVTLIDETSEKIRTSETAREETERSVQFYMEHVPALISFSDQDERLRFANRAYLDYFGLEADITGHRISEYLSEEEYARRAPYIAAALQGERQVFDISRTTEGGAAQTWQVLYQPRIEAGDVVGFFGVYQDITARRVAEEGLMEAYATLEDKVRERTAELEAESAKRLALVEDLETANALAEAATQSKTRFLAAASHDLLQPLSAARLLTSALGSELEAAPDDTQSLLQRIDQSIENADLLLRALLDISRLDAGGVTPDISRFPLDALISETAAPMAEKAAEKGLSLRTVPSGLWVESDRGLMMSVLQNLIANAVRYTQSGGVLIGARRQGKTIALQVIDTGPGIAPEARRQVFKEFERGQGTRADDRGLGLGLAIVDRIVQRLGHTVTILDGPKGGSVFQVTLPRCAPQADPKPKRRVRSRTRDLTGVEVLCLDNDPAVLEGFTELLGRWGCQVTAARDEAEARTAYPDSGPDLAIIDYQLDDGETGPDVFERLCEDWGAHPPALLATAEKGPHVEAAATRLGMDVIAKPVAPAVLRASLTALQTRRRQKSAG
jgi:PAS domain S-box-containing protein